MDARSVLEIFEDVASAVADVLSDVEDWGLSGRRPGQYLADLAVDEAALPILRSAGFGILSEESGGENLDAAVVVCLDPLDGSTNASRGIPHFATSLCAVDSEGPWVALVAHHARDRTWRAVRGEGARGASGLLVPQHAPLWSQAVVTVSGPPPSEPGWHQYRAFGAAAIDLCLVADGTVDAFVDMSDNAHGVWDFAAGALICREAGVEVRDAFDRELFVIDHSSRRTPVAAPAHLIDDAMAVRSRVG